MRIGFIHSNKYLCYEKLVEEIIQKLAEQLANNQIIVESISNINTRKKYDLYVFLSDDVEDFDAIFSKVKDKTKVILITENLSEKYITYVINNVVDIIYGKNSVEMVVKRILGNLRNLTC